MSVNVLCTRTFNSRRSRERCIPRVHRRRRKWCRSRRLRPRQRSPLPRIKHDIVRTRRIERERRSLSSRIRSRRRWWRSGMFSRPMFTSRFALFRPIVGGISRLRTTPAPTACAMMAMFLRGTPLPALRRLVLLSLLMFFDLMRMRRGGCQSIVVDEE